MGRKREKIEALVLSRRDIGEADRLLTVLAKDKGMIRVLANGVRKIPSRRGGHGEPLTEISAIIHGTGERHWLVTAETSEYFVTLHNDWDAQKRALGAASVLVGLYGEDDSSSSLYDAMRDTWMLWPSLPSAKRDLLETALLLTLMKVAGLAPNLRQCARCKSKDTRGEAVVLDPREGGWYCLTCFGSLNLANLSLTERGFRVVKFAADRPHLVLRIKIDDDESRQVIGAIRSYVARMLSALHVRAVAADSKMHGN